MNIPDYRDCDLPMRDDRTEAHWQAWHKSAHRARSLLLTNASQ